MRERNVTLDYFKLIMMFFVITAHLQPLFETDSLLGWLTSNGFVRLTMPSFLMINGYFIYTKIENPKAVYEYVKRMFILYLLWSLIYLPNFYAFPVKRLLLAIFTGYFHLWYILSLLVGVLLLFVVKRIFKRDNVLLGLLIFLYLCGYVLQYITADFPVSTAFKLAISRNGLFYGMPFIFMGYYVRKYETRLLSIKNKYLYVTAVVCVILMFYESYLSFFDRIIRDMLIIAPLLCPILFVIILKHSRFAAKDGYISNLASGVYFTHVIAMALVFTIFGDMMEGKIVYMPFVFFISMLLGAMVIEVNKRVKWFL